tara:strand:+ start:257 stop:2719 length:2463 start_codon:yes stop_codon:yes gene_type:complete
MPQIDTTFVQLVWQQFWQCSLLVLAVYLICKLFRFRRSHLTFILWLIVLLKFLTPPVWSSSSGLFCWVQKSMTSTAAETPTHPEQRSLTLTESIRLLTGDDLSKLPDVDPDVSRNKVTVHDGVASENRNRISETATVLPETAFNKSGQPAFGWSLIDVGLILWTFVAMLIISVMGIRYGRCWRTIGRAGYVNHPELTQLLTRLCSDLRLKRKVRLLITNSRIGPAVIGLFRPTILLPTAITGARTSQELEPILAHELIHIRRGDLWIGLLQLLASVVWWFHPLVWFTGRRLKFEIEQCCDEEVLAELNCDPRLYAKSLLEVLELKQTLNTVPVVPGVRPVEITSKRLERIMKLGQGCQKRTPWWCWMIFITLAAVVLPGAAFVVTAADQAGEKTAVADDQSGVIQAVKPAGVKRSPLNTGANQLQADLSKPSQHSSENEIPSLLPPDSVRRTYTLDNFLGVDLLGAAWNVVGRERSRGFLLEQIQSRISELSDEMPDGQSSENTASENTEEDTSSESPMRIAGRPNRKKRNGDCFLRVNELVVDSTDPVYHRLVKQVLAEFSGKTSTRIKVTAAFGCFTRSAFESWELDTKPVKYYSSKQTLAEQFGYFCNVETFEPEHVHSGELYHCIYDKGDGDFSRRRFRKVDRQKDFAGAVRGSALMSNGQMIRMTKKLDLNYTSIDEHIGQERGLYDSEQVLDLKMTYPQTGGEDDSILLDYKLSTSHIEDKSNLTYLDSVTQEQKQFEAPLMRKLYFQNATAIRPGQLILVGGLPLTTKKKDPFLLLLTLSVERVQIPSSWLMVGQGVLKVSEAVEQPATPPSR